MNAVGSSEFSPTPTGGLTSAQARQRLFADGANELPRPPRRNFLRILLGVLREPMFLLLVLAAAVYLWVGGLGEGLLLAAFAALSVMLVVVQEQRSENALEALRALAAPMARVRRDGVEQRIAAREVVVGDLLLFADGERIAADAVLRSGEAVSVDESLLTGESVPVGKRIAGERPDADGQAGDDTRVFAGTLVTAGRGVAQVFATGADTEAGRIGASLAAIDTGPTLLQRSLGRLVRLFAALGLSASVAVVLIFGLDRGDWLQGILSGIALGMAVLPEEFPMVLAVFVALGAHRLARLHVLVRRTAVIEVLGACSVLCVDKTGTLTENRMRVAALIGDGESVDLDGPDDVLPASLASLAGQRLALPRTPPTTRWTRPCTASSMATARRVERRRWSTNTASPRTAPRSCAFGATRTVRAAPTPRERRKR